MLYCSNSNRTVIPLQYREWQQYLTVSVVNTTVVNNSVVCASTCSGGGIAMTAGGQLIVSGSTIVNNAAPGFGGGLLLGGTSSGQSSCALYMEASFISGNTAQHAGAQLYNTCGGEVTINDSVIELSESNVEVHHCVVCLCGCPLIFWFSRAVCDAAHWIGRILRVCVSVSVSLTVHRCVWWPVRPGSVPEHLRFSVGHHQHLPVLC